ncbi:MAG: PEGA domain-containing protein [Chitinispirillaceae bacterium]|nr:PEGA domain-containing protein [Chitinispirillaceae bacterium]
MKRISCSSVMAICVCIGAIGGRLPVRAQAATGTVPVSEDTAIVDTPSTGAADATVAASPAAEFPLCTLMISTDPESASVTLDGTLFGQTPLQISNIDTGAHVLLLQKVGYYQKRVAFSLPSPGTSPMNFKLTSPGRIEITTIPDGAAVKINGTQRGVTPLVDSLVKPGKYRIEVVKEGYQPSAKTMDVSGGAIVHFTDSLLSTAPQPVATPQKPEREKGKFFTVGVVAGVFGLFMLVLAIIEARDFGG